MRSAAGTANGFPEVEKLTSILAVADDDGSARIAIDKAKSLARLFDARLEWTPSVSLDGKPLHDLIRERERIPDLVIKAAAGAHPLRRWTLHGNDWQLAHHCAVPLLLCGSRPWSQPMRLAAAVDVSDHDSSRFARSILQTAGFIALGCSGNLDVLYSEREKRDDTLRVARAVKLAQLVREFHVGCERLQMFRGAPEATLPRLISARHYDLVVLGAETHRDGISWLESLSSKIVDATDGDVLLVKPSEAARITAGSAASTREQRANLSEQLV